MAPAAPIALPLPQDVAAALLDLDPLGVDHFRARYNQDNHTGAIFGGQPMAQALAAARRTVPGWPVHSASALYLRSGDVALPVDYRVERLRDGRRFASRRVVASQAGRPIFDALCSFNEAGPGPAHQLSDLGDVPPPEALPDIAAFALANAARLSPTMARLYERPFPIDLRLSDPEQALFGTMPQPRQSYWLRMPSAAAIADPADHACLLAFLSDFWLAATPGAMHRADVAPDATLRVATLNHAVWLHAPGRVNEWLLYRTDTPWAGAGRGLARGLIYDRGGTLLASTMQEVTLGTG